MFDVHLVISERAAGALDRRISGHFAQPGDEELIDLIRTEIGSQLSAKPKPATTVAQDVAAKMATAGAAAVKEQAP